MTFFSDRGGFDGQDNSIIIKKCFEAIRQVINYYSPNLLKNEIRLENVNSKYDVNPINLLDDRYSGSMVSNLLTEKYKSKIGLPKPTVKNEVPKLRR